MLEPQSTVLFVLLVLGFGALLWWLVVARRIVFRVIAGVLAFVLATQFGILAVNRYFGYYQTWGAAVADLSNQSPDSGAEVSAGSLLVGDRSPVFDAHAIYLKLALLQGYTLHLDIAGKLSHITRSVYIYLPPQYFESQYKNYRFPVIELIHGQPGEPQDWINVVGVQVTLDQLVRRGQASPAVLVMPDANGGNDISLQCLNQADGPQDLTYLARDVPPVVAHMLRVQPPGVGWGVAGYSEGGFCAANMALRYRFRYGFAASMSGYFSPFDNKLVDPSRMVSPFGKNALLRRENTPLDEVRALAPGATLPQFWLGAGKADRLDTANAEYFWQELQLHQANVPLVLTPGGGHTMSTWHAEVPPMLAWMTKGLTAAVANEQRIALAKRAAASHHHSRRRPAIRRRSR
ncbi:MAG TPA: alpha/beta hydrolase-fold protein [Streptosporangiaceae bacterium]|jgi:enterochelin esterase-like enzyme|nr:alpha/beta hydrolase-fold protein [Streptosporangiaceae bacterium]